MNDKLTRIRSLMTAWENAKISSGDVLDTIGDILADTIPPHSLAEFKADHTLRASNVELLAALIRVTNAYDAHRSPTESASEAIKLARRVISKAEGRL